jgi:ribosomal protein S18 acetylase RimI-like enzyme
MSDAVFRNAQAADTARCFEIETTAYEGDEAATYEKIALRIDQYPQGFLVLQVAGQVVGFINSGCAYEVAMADEKFKELIGHDAAAPNVVIMSVVVAPAWQGKGYAAALMSQFVQRMREMGKASIHLMCREQHVALYRKLGYDYVKPSDSSHGGLLWHEMVMPL